MLLDLSIQHVSTQKYCNPSRLACSPQNRILSYPDFLSPVLSVISLKLTSSVSGPHVCESIAYRGMLSKNWVRVNPPSLLYDSKRISQIALRKSLEEKLSMGRRARMDAFAELGVKVGSKVMSPPSCAERQPRAMVSLWTRARPANRGQPLQKVMADGWTIRTSAMCD